MSKIESRDVQWIVGKTPVAISAVDNSDDDHVAMTFSDGTSCKLYHDQDGCEMVGIVDVNGDWNSLIGTPILVADERINQADCDTGYDDRETWTFYTFRGLGGSVDMRWHGTSNGYYSEGVDFKGYAA